MTRHIHLDLVGGLSGDMFISAMLDAFPEFRDGLGRVLEQAGFPGLVSLHTEPFNDGLLTGTRFTVRAGKEQGHHHRHYPEIRDRLTNSDLPEPTRRGALTMFHELAVVEAAIHGKEVEAVVFHEVGAWDSVVDIVLASHLAVSMEASWSVSPVPAGSGFVETAHGRLPVPAPATARLLEGFELVDDGIEGERVTPTGAVILRWLDPSRRRPAGLVLRGSGYGFGTRRFPGISNTARVLVFEQATQDVPWLEDTVMRLSFELDDQTQEEIADAVTRLRGLEGTLDVSGQVMSGKKGRQATAIVLLVAAEQADRITAACFEFTTTLGVRREWVQRAVLPRHEVVVCVGQKPYRVKVAQRPSGYTAKVAMDDLAANGLSLREQHDIRREAEALAIRQVQQSQV